MGKHVLQKKRRGARTVIPAAAAVALSGALAASPLGLPAASADPGPGGDDHHNSDGGHHDHDGWGGHHHHGGDHDGQWGDRDHHGSQVPQKPAKPAAPAPAAAAPAPAAPPAAPPAPVVVTKQFPREKPTLMTDLSGTGLDKAGQGALLKVDSTSGVPDDNTVGAVVGTGIALASVGGFAALLASGRMRRGAA